MYRFLAQIAYILIDPFIWAMLLFMVAWYKRNKENYKKYFIGGILVLLIFSNRFIANAVMNIWEFPPADLEQIQSNRNIGILLGGFSQHESERPYGGMFFYYNTYGANRLSHALELYQEGFVDTLIISDGFVDKNSSRREIDVIRKYFLDINIDVSRIIFEEKGVNTHLNAVHCTTVVKNLNHHLDHSIFLITSASHMRRALACFKKQGLNVIPLAVDHKASDPEISAHSFIPSAQALVGWKIMMKEWVGLIVYKLLGYT